MSSPTQPWQNSAPGDLSHLFPQVSPGDVSQALDAAGKAAVLWRKTSFAERANCLRVAHDKIQAEADLLAREIALETGKPIKESHGEVGAVLAKMHLTIADYERHCQTKPIVEGPQPAWLRYSARGPAVVIAPFNFPLHLGNGALTAHLLAGNPVLFKPSPFAAQVAAHYARMMSDSLPEGVFTLVQGGAAEAEALCLAPVVRSICFTGSAAAGRAIAQNIAGDFNKDLALELGGKNAVIVCADADLDAAAVAVAEATCLTAGQRCNATSRVIVDDTVADSFCERLLEQMKHFVPGDPLNENTRLGPLISEASAQRYAAALQTGEGRVDWLQSGAVVPEVAEKRGHYVQPTVARHQSMADALKSPLWLDELFAPLVTIAVAHNEAEMILLHNAAAYGLTASIFTRSRDLFLRLGDELQVGNLYANLPTTFSPSTLPFGGWGESGNHHPGGRGFIRYCVNEQAVQVAVSSGFEL